MSKRLAKTAAVIGVASTGVFALLTAGLYITTSREQATTPGEKNLGVAALIALFAMPMMVCAAAVIISFLISGVAFIYSRLRQR